MPREALENILIYGQSPYFAMFQAGRNGYTFDEVTNYCSMIGIPLREKDIQSWEDGWFKHQMISQMQYETINKQRKEAGYYLNPIKQIKPEYNISIPNIHTMIHGKPFDSMRLEDFPRFPDGWVGTQRRFFPCNADNIPMCPWGWKPGFDPQLMLKADAKVLSPVGWVGQNMLYQTFIVLDIDGVGHGCIDERVIRFGEQFKNYTLTLEDPKKVGSFHLYFETDRIIPVKHFVYAKLDLMGNSVNAAVYLKNKQSNGVPPMKLTNEIWDAMMSYQKSRKEQ